MKETTMIQIFAPIVLIILSTTPFSTSALTTFGKTNPQTQNQPAPPPTPVGKARECKIDSDCTAIQNTTCMADPRDGKTRCLCGDYSAPINGMCNIKWKAILASCNEDSECGEGAHCIEKNNTGSGKKCYCKEGYYEENLRCNGAESLLRFSSVALMTVALLLVYGTDYST